MDASTSSLGGFRETRDAPFALSASGLAMSTEDPITAKAREAAAASSLAATTTSSKPAKPPSMRICHLCGTPQLLKSFRCHVGRCAQAWLAEEATKPEPLRRPLPRGPEVAEGGPRSAAREPNQSRAYAVESRRRRGCDVDIPWRRAAATPRPRRGYSAETNRGDLTAPSDRPRILPKPRPGVQKNARSTLRTPP